MQNYLTSPIKVNSSANSLREPYNPTNVSALALDCKIYLLKSHLMELKSAPQIQVYALA